MGREGEEGPRTRWLDNVMLGEMSGKRRQEGQEQDGWTM